MSGPKLILLAEDSPQDVEMTLAALGGPGPTHEVAVVNDGEQALDYLQRRGSFASRNSGNPDLVLLDLKMPKIDGLEVLRSIREDATLRTTPVVMLTSSREEQDLVRSYQLGVNAYVVKPVDFLRFVEAVKNLGMFWIQLNEPAPRPAGPPAAAPT